MEIKNRIKKEFEKAGEGFIVLLDARAASYHEAVMEATALLLNKGEKGVYITASRPYKFIFNEMKLD